MELVIIIIVALVIVAAIVGGGLYFLRPRRGAGRGAPPTPPTPGQGGPGTGTATAERPGTATAEPSLPPLAPGPPPVAEAPPPLAGRMVRLRGRLARSQSGFGAVLLGLLSRDSLDDQAWEEIKLEFDRPLGPERATRGWGSLQPIITYCISSITFLTDKWNFCSSQSARTRPAGCRSIYRAG